MNDIIFGIALLALLVYLKNIISIFSVILSF
jgi:hypothetical protein